jgi:hypothetical protein
MDGGVAAVLAGAVGFVGTALGGLAAVYGAKIGAERNAAALLQQVRRQAESERSQWIRGQRVAAYQQFLKSWDEYTLARGAFHTERPPSYVNWRSVQQLGGRLATATFNIRIVGPEEVTAVAQQATDSVMAMLVPSDLEAEFRDAYARFRETSAPELQDRMVEIAEEILYKGSWDSAIDVYPLRQRFLDAASEALGDL